MSPEDLYSVDTVHKWLAEKGDCMFAGKDVRTPEGRRHAAEWFSETLDEILDYTEELDRRGRAENEVAELRLAAERDKFENSLSVEVTGAWTS